VQLLLLWNPNQLLISLNSSLENLKKVCRLTENGMYCETDPKTSAKLLHRLGEYYLNKTSSVKENFIFCSGLLAAAQSRAPDDMEIMLSQNNMWISLLEQARACAKVADLNHLIANLRGRLKFMRETT